MKAYLLFGTTRRAHEAVGPSLIPSFGRLLLGSVRERGGLFHRVGGVTGVAIEDVGLWWSCELQPLTEETPDDRDQYDAD